MNRTEIATTLDRLIQAVECNRMHEAAETVRSLVGQPEVNSEKVGQWVADLVCGHATTATVLAVAAISRRVSGLTLEQIGKWSTLVSEESQVGGSEIREHQRKLLKELLRSDSNNKLRQGFFGRLCSRQPRTTKGMSWEDFLEECGNWVDGRPPSGGEQYRKLVHRELSRIGGAASTPLRKPEIEPSDRSTTTEATTATPADVFVSFKNLDADGFPTRDSLIAKTVAAYLRKQGFSVFLSLDSLEQLGKSAYTAAIDDALERATILVAIGTSKQNLTSRWVKYEWYSFHQDLIEVKPYGELFTVTEGMNMRDLPRALRQRQNFSCAEEDLAKLARFIGRALGHEVAST